MRILVGGSEHTKDDYHCDECVKGYPRRCECGALIHAQFLKEDWQKVTTLAVLCENCGDKYKFPGQDKVFRRPKMYRRKI